MKLKRLMGGCFLSICDQKEAGSYLSYQFCIPEDKIEMVEDYGSEEIVAHNSITDALFYFQSKDVKIECFSSFKGCCLSDFYPYFS